MLNKTFVGLCAVAMSLGAQGAVGVARAATSPATPFSVKSILTMAADRALGKLSLPGGFLTNEAVRIAVPGLGGSSGTASTASSVLSAASSLGVGDSLTKSVNSAASSATLAAKPLFTQAINNFKITDVPTVLATNDGGTQYLKNAMGSQLRAKMRPLIVSALAKSGAFGKLGALGSLGGVTQDVLTDSVTDQALKGIFSTMGSEEAALRANPAGVGASLLQSMLKR